MHGCLFSIFLFSVHYAGELDSENNYFERFFKFMEYKKNYNYDLFCLFFNCYLHFLMRCVNYDKRRGITRKHIKALNMLSYIIPEKRSTTRTQIKLKKKKC